MIVIYIHARFRMSSYRKCRSQWPRSLRDELSYCLHPFKHRGCGFESQPRHGYLCLVRACVVLCLGTGCSPVKGVLPFAQRLKKLEKRSRPNK
jgi:hypothetical protein